jgi:hypothetical protein
VYLPEIVCDKEFINYTPTVKSGHNSRVSINKIQGYCDDALDRI